MPHDRQVIIGIITGRDDSVIKDGARDLRLKWEKKNKGKPHFIQFIHPKEIGSVIGTLKAHLEKLGRGARLYIEGHGDWANHTCGGLNGKEVASFLNRNGLSKDVGLISVTACHGAAGGSGRSADSMKLSLSMKSFTGVLHAELGSKHGIWTRCFGRVGSSVTYDTADDMVGRKATYLRNGSDGKQLDVISSIERIHPDLHAAIGRQSFSKICFFWDGKHQKQEWVDYGVTANYDAESRSLGSEEAWKPRAPNTDELKKLRWVK